jgi:hypothetical protein
MRIWSLHPALLDAKGLVALWRETLLAQAVLLGKTKGYRNHPQLDRFKAQADPAAAVAAYLAAVAKEADARGYRFDAAKIGARRSRAKIAVTAGQVAYELDHLKRKLAARDPARLVALAEQGEVPVHPLFKVVPGPVEAWEVV